MRMEDADPQERRAVQRQERADEAEPFCSCPPQHVGLLRTAEWVLLLFVVMLISNYPE